MSEIEIDVVEWKIRQHLNALKELGFVCKKSEWRKDLGNFLGWTGKHGKELTKETIKFLSDPKNQKALQNALEIGLKTTESKHGKKDSHQMATNLLNALEASKKHSS